MEDKSLLKKIVFYLSAQNGAQIKNKNGQTKSRSLIFVKRGKPQGGCFLLAQGPVLWWPLPACWGLLLAAMFDPRSPRSQQKKKKNLNSVWLGWSTPGSRTVRSAEDWPTILCSCLEEQTPREPLTEPLVGPRGEPRHVSQPQFTELCVVNQIYDPKKLNKVILEMAHNPNQLYWLGCCSEVSH